MITNDIGCRGSIRKIMTLKESQPFIPNTFTPNGDGIHDHFETKFNARQSLYFKKFDRWGKMVFFSQDPNQKWDGKTDGNDAAVGIYYYVLKGQDYLKKEVIAKGLVQLVLPRSKSNEILGVRPSVSLKEVINAIFYLKKNGCSWASLPLCW